MKYNYPATRKCEASDLIFGQKVTDPYRWLEDDTSPEVAQWVKAQNEVTYSLLESIPERKGIRDRMAALWNHPRYSAPFRRGKWTYYFKNNGLQNQGILYREKEGMEPVVFLDPNGFSEDGTASLAGIGFSPDGTFAAYKVSLGGAYWQSIRVISCDRPDVVLEEIPDVKFSGVSWKGSEGFYYSCYEKPDSGTVLSAKTTEHRLMFHKLGTPSGSDVLVFGGSETPRRYINGTVTEDGRWLWISASISTTGNELYIQDLSKPGSRLIRLAAGFDREYTVVHSDDEHLFVLTNLEAPNNRLVQVDMSCSASPWTDIIPERNEVLSVSSGGGYLFASYLKDALSVVEQVNCSGKVVRTIELPGRGTALVASALQDDETVYYHFSSYINPSEIWALDVSTGNSSVFRSSGVDFDPSMYLSEQVFYSSADGTRVPMMITRRKDLIPSGDNPCILYGYGGFNVSITPGFSVSAAVWIEQGGVYAVPNIRGGGEYGEVWHLAGTKTSKQNVFDDFIAAAEYLCSAGWTRPSKLVASGGSNGGLLVGAMITQRPDLFGAAIPAVGVLDMLRYHKFTAGAGWSYDYGTADDSEEMFRYLLGYSPLHNVKKRTSYPAVMITTGDHDDRVVPAHSFKFAAALQEGQTGEAPVLIRIDVNAGHGAGKPMGMLIDSEADRLSFALHHLNQPCLTV